MKVVLALVAPVLNHAKTKKMTILSKKITKTLADSKNSRTFATAIEKQTMQRKNEILVPWMSGLVSGLQNRVRRFESARNLFLMKEGSLGEWLKPPVC